MTTGESPWGRLWRRRADGASSETTAAAEHGPAPSRDSIDEDLAEVQADLERLFTTVVQGVKDGADALGEDIQHVELDFGLKLKAGLSDVLALFVDLDENTNVRVKVTLQHPKAT